MVIIKEGQGVSRDYIEISGFIKRGSTIPGTQMDICESSSMKEFFLNSNKHVSYINTIGCDLPRSSIFLGK